jgi:hypothetical protein
LTVPVGVGPAIPDPKEAAVTTAWKVNVCPTESGPGEAVRDVVLATGPGMYTVPTAPALPSLELPPAAVAKLRFKEFVLK